MSDTMLGRAFNTARNIAEDALERVEKRWDQAMDVIHVRQIRDTTRDAEREEREIQNALGGGEQFAAQARERLDYQLRHPGPGEIAERHADLAGDATVDRSDAYERWKSHAAVWARHKRSPSDAEWAARDRMNGTDIDAGVDAMVVNREQLLEKFAVNRPISWEVVGDRQILPFVDGKENGTMDREVKAAKEHVREREQERWTRVEQIGRQAIDADRARVTEKPTVTTEADLATKAERQRPQTA